MTAKRIFLSCAHEDGVRAAEMLSDALANRLYSVWWDARLRGGVDFTGQLDEKHAEADVVIVLWTRAAIQSRWVRAEVEAAIQAGKLLPILVDPSLTFGDLPLNARNLPSLEIPESRLVIEIERILAAIDSVEPSRPTRSEISALPDAGGALVGRARELDMLRRAWRDPKTRVVSLIAMGGAGKTALVQAFLQELSAGGWGGAERAFAWSIYRQSSGEGAVGSESSFFQAAWKFFGHAGQPDYEGRDAGVELSRVLLAKRTLLVIDGLEPLQALAGGEEGGKLQALGMRALLKNLASAGPDPNGSMIIVTSRQPIRELAQYAGGAYLEHDLEALDAATAVKLARARGVTLSDEDEAEAIAALEDRALRERSALRLGGRRVSDRAAALAAAIEEVERHALSVTLMAGLVRIQLRGDIRRWRAAARPLLASDAKTAHATLRRYEEAFAAGRTADGVERSVDLMILRIMGLFDRPAPVRAIRQALLSAPAIPGLTEAWMRLSAGQRVDLWNAAVDRLRALSLLNKPEAVTDEEMFDAHPLVREYFKRRLLETAPKAAEESHRRLYELYKLDGLPDTLRDPLIYMVAAMAAGVGAEKVQLVLFELRRIYSSDKPTDEISDSFSPAWNHASNEDRLAAIQYAMSTDLAPVIKAMQPDSLSGLAPLYAAIAHGCQAGRLAEAYVEVMRPRIDRGVKGFAEHELGAMAEQISAYRWFFSSPFTEVDPRFPRRATGQLLGNAGFALTHAGRLRDALEPMEQAYRDKAPHDDPDRQEAASTAATNLCRARIALGDAALAISLAKQAAEHAAKASETSCLSFARSYHGAALFAHGEPRSALQSFLGAEVWDATYRPRQPRLASNDAVWLINLLVAIGASAFVEARAQAVIDMSDSARDVGGARLALGELRRDRDLAAQGLGDLRAARFQLDLTEGLTRRAALLRALRDLDTAEADLDEAFDYADFGEMKLYLIPIAMERARIALARGDMDAAEAQGAEARRVFDSSDLGRWKPELLLLEARLALEAGRPPDLWRAAEAIEPGFWSVLPELEALTRRADALGELGSKIKSLKHEHDAFLAEHAAYERRLDDIAAGDRPPPEPGASSA